MKILILATNYTNNEGLVSLEYIRTRNISYVESYNLQVDVLNFNAESSYIIDEMRVFSYSEFDENLLDYDVVVSHAPNIRNHYNFLIKNCASLKHVVFFFHGHEVLDTFKDYPSPYKFVSSREKTMRLFHVFYDKYKFLKLKKLFKKLENSNILIDYIFVSEWMLKKFNENVRVSINDNNIYIIPNQISIRFVDNIYSPCKLEYDFVTIRTNIDGSKYAIDLVVEMATQLPNLKFLIIGKGKFFEYNRLPENITYINKHLNHEEIESYLNKCKVALMPSRLDSQGVMVCEMASFGIPVITSNLEVKKEFLGDNNNVLLLDNNNFTLSNEQLDNVLKLYKDMDRIKEERIKTIEKFSKENTTEKEVNVFEQ